MRLQTELHSRFTRTLQPVRPDHLLLGLRVERLRLLSRPAEGNKHRNLRADPGQVPTQPGTQERQVRVQLIHRLQAEERGLRVRRV